MVTTEIQVTAEAKVFRNKVGREMISVVVPMLGNACKLVIIAAIPDEDEDSSVAYVKIVSTTENGDD